jgi:hypothetical protein
MHADDKYRRHQNEGRNSGLADAQNGSIYQAWPYSRNHIIISAGLKGGVEEKL